MAKVEICVEVRHDAAERIKREVKRQEFVEALTKLINEAREAGFRVCPADPDESYESRRERVMFSDIISLDCDDEYEED